MRYNVNNLNEKKRFIQFPMELMYGERYKKLSVNAKMIYVTLCDRLSLSKESGRVDNNGDIYVFFPADKLSEKTGIALRTVMRALSELKEWKLIESEKVDRANKYYINQVEQPDEQNEADIHAKMADDTCQNGSNNEDIHAKMADDTCQIGSCYMPNWHTINTNIIKTKRINTKDSLSSATLTRKRAPDDTPYDVIVSLFNETCTDLPQVKALSDSRRKAIKARFKELDRDTDKIRELFIKVQSSDFLSGRKEGSNWRAGFDWIMKPSNTAKILEGNYDNREGKGNKEVTESGGCRVNYSQYEEYERNGFLNWE